MSGPPLARIPVGVVVERHKAACRGSISSGARCVLEGVAGCGPWTLLDVGEVTTFYAGAADIELYRTETAHYRDNLATGSPGLWVVMSPTDGDPPYRLVASPPIRRKARAYRSRRTLSSRCRCRPGYPGRRTICRRTPCRAAVRQTHARPGEP